MPSSCASSAGLQAAVKAQGDAVKGLKARRLLLHRPTYMYGPWATAEAASLCAATPQDKAAQKDEIDAAVNKLKQLKIDLEAAVKVRQPCGARGLQHPLTHIAARDFRLAGSHR